MATVAAAAAVEQQLHSFVDTKVELAECELVSYMLTPSPAIVAQRPFAIPAFGLALT